MAVEYSPSIVTLVEGSRGGWTVYQLYRYAAVETKNGTAWKRQELLEDWNRAAVGARKRLPQLAKELSLPYARSIRQWMPVPIIWR